MHRGTIAALAGLLLAVAIAAGLLRLARGPDEEVVTADAPIEQGGLELPARVEGSRLALAVSSPRPCTAGGRAMPGHVPFVSTTFAPVAFPSSPAFTN